MERDGQSNHPMKGVWIVEVLRSHQRVSGDFLQMGGTHIWRDPKEEKSNKIFIFGHISFHFNNHFDLEIFAICPKSRGHETDIVDVYLKSRSPLSKILFLVQGFLPQGRLVSFLNDDPDVITISLFFKITF